MKRNNTIFLLVGSLGFQALLFGQTPDLPEDVEKTLPIVEPHVIHDHADYHAARRVYMLPHFATTVRMRDAVQSIVLGDTKLFRAEHDEGDASLVIVHALTAEPAQTNVEITTISGQQVVLWLVSEEHPRAPVDFALDFDAPAPSGGGPFWRPESKSPSVLIAQTISVDRNTGAKEAGVPSLTPISFPAFHTDADPNTHLDELLKRQQQAPLPKLYGQHPEPMKDDNHLKAGVSEVIDGGGTVIVLFSLVNTAPHAIALLAPQVQLGGQVKKKWTTSDQLPVLAYRLDRERLEPNGRANGVVVFERPSFKQAKQCLFLQQADSGAVDEPALAPIGFGISTEKGGVAEYGNTAK
ncbi:MAG TPA: hypothetical protein VFB14_17680 [Bryobacteraceae bacterium]|nr:hypothetical protein [Bryobacteraceae bacterium]